MNNISSKSSVSFYPFHHSQVSFRALAVTTIIAVVFADTLILGGQHDLKTCAFLGSVTVLSVLLILAKWKELKRSPEWRLFIVINTDGITMLREKTIMLQLPWARVHDIQICVGKREDSYMTSADCYNVCIAGYPISNRQQFDKMTSLNILQEMPTGDVWILYLNRGTKEQCKNVISMLEQFVK
jgi:hypothetical protein